VIKMHGTFCISINTEDGPVRTEMCPFVGQINRAKRWLVYVTLYVYPHSMKGLKKLLCLPSFL
jgi:hypothetical protein